MIARHRAPSSRKRRYVAAACISLVVATTAVLSGVALAAGETPQSTTCIGSTPGPDGQLRLDCVVPMPPAVTVTAPASTVTVTSPVPVPTTTTVTTTVTVTVPATTVPPTTPPPTTPPPSTGFPGTGNTGIPAGTVLTDYTGPCRITAANTVVDAKRVPCILDVRATGVTITRSSLPGISGYGFTVSDSDIDVSPIGWAGAENDGINGWSFTAIRVNIHGGRRGVNCQHDATIRDSWIHGTEMDPNGNWHASGLRAEYRCTVEHNTIACDWPDSTSQGGGCSADLTMYPDFSTVHHNTITRNLFVANPNGNGYCTYFGYIPSKPYGGFAENATYIVVTNNVFQRGTLNGQPARCGYWGPVTSWGFGRVGNVWSGNTWDSGGTVNPA